MVEQTLTRENIKYHAPLHDYQKIAVESVLFNGNKALFLEMGLGKTLATLEIIYQLKHKLVLIIAPKIIADSVWGPEIEKWEYPFDYYRLAGSPAKRCRMLNHAETGIFTMTPELVPWLCLNDYYKIFDMVVIDEITKFKNTKSKRWRALSKQVKQHPNIMRIGLTGTPSPNGLHELWGQLFILDNGKTLGKFKGKYLNAFFRDTSPEPRKFHQWRLLRGSEERILRRMRECGIISMKANQVLQQEDIINLPNLIIDMPAAARKIYKELEVDLMATMPDGTLVLPEYETTISIKMRQLSSGFMIDDDGVTHIIHWEKAKALKEYLELVQGQPQLIVFIYKAESKMIQKILGPVPMLAGGTSAKLRQSYIESWNKGLLPAMLVQPQAAGHGINLQDGGHNILFYSSDYNLETYQQVRARIHRQGQKETVFSRHMIGGSIENRIIQSLNRKAKQQDRLMTKLHT